MIPPGFPKLAARLGKVFGREIKPKNLIGADNLVPVCRELLDLVESKTADAGRIAELTERLVEAESAKADAIKRASETSHELKAAREETAKLRDEHLTTKRQLNQTQTELDRIKQAGADAIVDIVAAQGLDLDALPNCGGSPFVDHLAAYEKILDPVARGKYLAMHRKAIAAQHAAALAAEKERELAPQ